MAYAKITKNSTGIYTRVEASNIEMQDLGYFFTDDVRCRSDNPFRDWALDGQDYAYCNGNYSELEREMNHVFLWCQYTEELVPTKLKMTVEQFVQLYDEWQTKVVKFTPKVVIIKHENGQFTIETSNEPSNDSIDENVEQAPEPLLEKNVRDIELDYEHILLFDLTFTENRMPVIKGLHYDSMNFIEHASPLEWANKKVYAGGFYEAQLRYEGQYVKDVTCFPAHWTYEQVIECILDSYDQWKKSGAKPKYLPGGNYIVKSLTQQNIEIHMYITASNKIKTAYPVFKKRNQRWKLLKWLW